MSLLLALAEEMPEEGKADWMEERLLAGMEGWVKEQTEQKYRDESMVEKVRKLEAAIRELSDDEEQKFSVEELAAYLDMDEEEIRAVLRLTSEGAKCCPPPMEQVPAAVRLRREERKSE